MDLLLHLFFPTKGVWKEDTSYLEGTTQKKCPASSRPHRA